MLERGRRERLIRKMNSFTEIAIGGGGGSRSEAVNSICEKSLSRLSSRRRCARRLESSRPRKNWTDCARRLCRPQSEWRILKRHFRYFAPFSLLARRRKSSKCSLPDIRPPVAFFAGAFGSAVWNTTWILCCPAANDVAPCRPPKHAMLCLDFLLQLA